ncbi:8-oxo-dGTP diphosphatase [Kluyveromyces lactis]|uniref:KLLA0D17292p n=1 Tax=Kluyveromyces lactis (strain ATCC 8585 / CBS 2359 / DSM 70799 / NBRC 1267 / NRRL Y-1140 / WM37) TaxID=284590 RepID=Q6CQG4_KLULA|nr:uncharacterized protein KLLA0_D17292g [Kluyveromyces lactis]CAH00921.1 KLLA0D17292p [Kluyveromyces lactis]|eukprot:XP_453825.1 uncharacterized protein KLLA0_D17292g [Kluyveromyces lactis]
MIVQVSRMIGNLSKFSRLNLSLPTPCTWPASRRSAVLVLLFVGTRGELRVLLTKRSRKLRSFAGQVSLPGGKADNGFESFQEVALRETEEEIGLPRDPVVLRDEYGLQIDPVCETLPHYLSKTFLSVKPLVCFMYNSKFASENGRRFEEPLNISKIFAKLNAGETSSLFSIPLSDLICHEHKEWKGYKPEYIAREQHIYKWGGLKWPLRYYYYPMENIGESQWVKDVIDESSGDEQFNSILCKNVWGLTAKILYDVARIAHGIVTGENSDSQIGHEELIYGLHEFGSQMRDRSRSDWEIGMIENSRHFKYADVIPSFYLDHVKKSTANY